MTFVVTGTDTNIGKTVFSGIFSRYLIDVGLRLYICKPFCSGGTGDINFLKESVYRAIDDEKLNYWYDDSPISPAARELRSGIQINFNDIFQALGSSCEKYDVVMIEGAGGLLSPVSLNHYITELGSMLKASYILIAPNRVGVVNHVLLTVEAALSRGLNLSCVVLMGQKDIDESSIDNAELIRIHLPEMIDFKGVYEFPWLGDGADDPELVALNVKKADGVLGAIFEACVLPILVRNESFIQ